MQHIKNIIFDLGGVFLPIDFAKTKNAFIDLGIKNFDAYFTQTSASNLFEELETGKITPQQFYDAFRAQTNTNITNEQIAAAWNALLGEFYLDRIEWLDEISKRYKVFLLSNTNIIHTEIFKETYRRQTGNNNFDDHFIKAYYSHDIGLRKPYVESYEHVLREENLLPSETIFIDDTLPNIEGAKLAGLHTFYLLPHLHLKDVGL